MSKGTARRLLLPLHLVAGLLSAVFLTILGLTGGLLVFEGQIDHWLNPQLSWVTPHEPPLSLDELTARVEGRHPGTRVSNIIFPGDPRLGYTVTLRTVAPGSKGMTVAVDPYTGNELGDTASRNNFTRQLHQFHTNLLLGPKGKVITAWSAFFLLGLAITGLVLWWPAKITKLDGAPGRRAFEVHNVVGIYASVFMLLFAVTGIVIHWDDEAQQFVRKWRGETQPPQPRQIPGGAKGGKPLSPGRIAAITQEKYPGAVLATIQGVGSAGAPVRVTLKYPEDRTPAGRSILLIHPVTGEILWEQSSRTGPLSIRLVKLWNREFHTGDIGGWPTRIIACAASFSLPLLAITGPIIWVQKLRKRKKRGATELVG